MSVVTVTNDNFETEVMNSQIPVVVDFFASWCGPCSMFAPIFEKAAAIHEGTAKFVKINIEEAKELARKNKVLSIPTVLVYKQGKVVDRQSKVLSEEELDAMLTKNSD